MLLTLLFVPSYGYHYFPYINIHWDKNPNICIEFDNKSVVYKHKIISGIKEWKTKLGEPYDYKIYDHINSDCNVYVFFDTGNKKDLTNDLVYGYTSCHPNKDRTIHYCEVELFLNNLPVKHIRPTIVHEMGHVLGLGHVTVNKPQYSPWLIIQNDIMMKAGSYHQKITQDDLDAIKQLYGKNGFLPPNYPQTKWHPEHPSNHN
jgi:hypothetical protein